MSDRHHPPDSEISRADAELVSRISENYRPSEPNPAARVAFRAGIDARIRRRASRRLWWTGAATVAAAAAFAMLRGSLPASAPAPQAPVAETLAEEDALLALTLPASSEAESLPADYQAIEDLFLEGEGV